MDWLTRHADTIVILGTFAACFWHLNEKVNSIDKEVAIVKTVLFMKNIMPPEVCKSESER